MSNERNAGRKPKIDDDTIRMIQKRIGDGESVSSLASEYGVTRQALYKRLNDLCSDREIQLDYYVDDELCSILFFDVKKEKIRLVNYSAALSKRAFGYNDDPTFDDLQGFLDREYIRSKGADSPECLMMVDDDKRIDVIKELSGDKGQIRIRVNEGVSVPSFFFSKKDIMIRRTDTDGYQLKAITTDRRHYVKSQAVMSGVMLRDWAVEIIASDICSQLGISHVIQRKCRFVYEGRMFDGVYSENFELDGYSFYSFEGLLERENRSTRNDEFIKFGPIEKLRWCADELSHIGNLPIELTLKYMLDLAVVDCLVGNTDRHTRNFGLFYNNNTSSYEIPLVFDNGMGLFENDSYRDRYESFDAAMNNVYVAPYGEDPFDMLRLLDKEFDLRKIYPGIADIHYQDILSTPFALEYERRMRNIWQK